VSAARRPTPRHRLEHALYRLASLALHGLPERSAVALGAGLGWLAGTVLGIRRDVVDENLARAFPERDAAWRRRIAAESYRHFGREAVVAFRLGRERAERVLARSEVHGLPALLEAVRGPGAIVATGHLGNWEVAGGAVALRDVPIDAVAVRQRNPLFDEALAGNRRRLGIRVVYRGVRGAEVLRSLRDGRVPVLLADQDAGHNGVFVDFLGHPASTTRGPALLALRSGARLFGGVCLVEPGPPRRYRIHLEPLSIAPSGDLAGDVRRLTEAHAGFLARYVREAPEQYFWQHKRWKTRP
jgi:Kdo2-lipid IVA lauroyltransferase/acyltransferase